MYIDAYARVFVSPLCKDCWQAGYVVGWGKRTYNVQTILTIYLEPDIGSYTVASCTADHFVTDQSRSRIGVL